MAVWIAALSAGSVTFAVPWVVAKTIVVWPPLKAGSLAVRMLAASCDSVPGMVKVSLVFPPLSWAMAMAAMAASSQTPSTVRRRLKARRAIRYRYVDMGGSPGSAAGSGSDAKLFTSRPSSE